MARRVRNDWGGERVDFTSGSFASNVSAVIRSAVSSPFDTSIVVERPLDPKLVETIHETFSRDKGKAEAIRKSMSVATDHHALNNKLAKPTATFVMSPYFKMVFLTVAAVTILCGIGQVAMAMSLGTPSAMQSDAFQSLGFAWKVGFGAIVGLIGGKVA
jgi:butyrate kinase